MRHRGGRDVAFVVSHSPAVKWRPPCRTVTVTAGSWLRPWGVSFVGRCEHAGARWIRVILAYRGGSGIIGSSPDRLYPAQRSAAALLLPDSPTSVQTGFRREVSRPAFVFMHRSSSRPIIHPASARKGSPRARCSRVRVPRCRGCISPRVGCVRSRRRTTGRSPSGCAAG